VSRACQGVTGGTSGDALHMHGQPVPEQPSTGVLDCSLPSKHCLAARKFELNPLSGLVPCATQTSRPGYPACPATTHHKITYGATHSASSRCPQIPVRYIAETTIKEALPSASRHLAFFTIHTGACVPRDSSCRGEGKKNASRQLFALLGVLQLLVHWLPFMLQSTRSLVEALAGSAGCKLFWSEDRR
jgi:hypothetical protein